MTETETKKIIASMMATYPNYRPDDIQLAISIWTDLFAEYSYQQVSMGVKAYMQSDTSGFAPAPGQVIDQIHKISCPPELNEQEAWSLVANAIRNSGYNSVEEFAKLPPTVQKAVGQPSQLRYWAIDENFNEEVAKASFQRAYKIECKRDMEFAKMPAVVKKLIENAFQTSHKAQIQHKNETMVNLFVEEKESEIKALETKRMCMPLSEQHKDRLKRLLEEE